MSKVTLKNVRFSYANVFEPKSIDGTSPATYSVSVIIPKTEKATIKAFEAAVEEAKQEGIKDKWGGKLPAKCALPLRDGDEEKPDDSAYANSFFFTAKSKLRPSVIGMQKEALASEDEFYSGCWGAISVNIYAYNHPTGGKGVSVGLGNLLKMKDGEKLGGGRSKAEDDFKDLLEDDDLL